MLDAALTWTRAATWVPSRDQADSARQRGCGARHLIVCDSLTLRDGSVLCSERGPSGPMSDLSSTGSFALGATGGVE